MQSYIRPHHRVIYVHSGPDSICALTPHQVCGFIQQPKTPVGFERAGLTFFAINFYLPKQSPGTHLHLQIIFMHRDNIRLLLTLPK